MKRVLLLAVLAAVIILTGGAALYAMRAEEPVETAQIQRSTPAPGAAATPPAAPASSELLAAGPLEDQVLGQPNAPVTIVEYASLTCPHCATFHNETFAALKQRYIDQGKVRFIFREFPLDNYATAGFLLARCSGEGKYFPVIEAFFKQQRALLAAPDPFAWIQEFAKQIGFTQESMEDCLTNQELLDGVIAMRQRASEKFGVSSTPTFFVNGKIKRGALTMQELEKEIEPLLKS